MNNGLELLTIAQRAGLELAAGYIRLGNWNDARPAAAPTRLTRPDPPIDKGHHDWVTEVDRESERLIAEVLRAATPRSHLMGEESSPDPHREGLVWIVDPLDGTTNFLHGYPQYAVSIAAARDGVLEAGVVIDITRECCYGAVRGQGAWCAGTRLSVSPTREAGRALLGTGFPFKHLDRLDEYLDSFVSCSRLPAGSAGPARPPWISRNRAGTAGRVLGADAGALGHRRGVAADPGSRRCGDRSGRPGHRSRAHRSGRRKSGDSWVAAEGVPQAAFVRIRGPSRVIATVCSKWAASEPSAVTTVHLSASMRVV